MNYLLDTNVLIGCLRGNPTLINTVEAYGRENDLAISTVTYGELMVGLLKNDTPRRRNALKKVLSPLRILEFDTTAATKFAWVKSSLERAGTVIGPYDMQIAGHAISTRRTLVSHNFKEFSRIPKLKLVDWE